MADRIDAMPKLSRGRSKKYDFTPYFDGNPWVLVRGTKEEVANGEADFDATLKSIRATLYRDAADKGLKVKSAFTTHNDREAIAITAVPNENGDKPASDAKKQPAKK